MEDLFFIQNGVRRRAKEIQCGHCNNKFLTRLNSDAQYCSRICKGASVKTSMVLECHECKKKFERTKYKAENSSKHNFHFCSRTCKEKAQSLKGSCLEIRPSHYGEGNGKSSYRKLAFESYDHKCNRCGYDKIVEVLQVHHKDKNRENNIVENLEIMCPTCHMEFHFLDSSGLYTSRGMGLLE